MNGDAISSFLFSTRDIEIPSPEGLKKRSSLTFFAGFDEMMFLKKGFTIEVPFTSSTLLYEVSSSSMSIDSMIIAKFMLALLVILKSKSKEFMLNVR